MESDSNGEVIPQIGCRQGKRAATSSLQSGSQLYKSDWEDDLSTLAGVYELRSSSR